ncbi:UPF0488 protein CG14286 isoform X2 [Bombus pascuorum]|uniref:UPF0488 protein CG14286 isoform X2 n=1 Tax=Bombus pascuorum TaxID=65598 RepID=UPI00298ECA82|nr:UPF0488 protein CG14286 isoform X2 [Bombus pascuorum]
MPSKPRTNAKKPTANKKNAEPPKLPDSASIGVETNSGLSQEAEDQFEVELCWCIQQLEMCLGTGKLPERELQRKNGFGRAKVWQNSIFYQVYASA